MCFKKNMSIDNQRKFIYMKTIIQVNKNYARFSDLFRLLPETFQSMGTLVHSGRNEVRIVQIDGVTFAIKYFKKMTIANRYIYALFRKSKAQRAFENSDYLQRHAVTSPVNVAYVDCYKHGMLRHAYYISLFTDYKPLKDLLALPLVDAVDGLKALARFTSEIHQKGIFHNDYSINNILYSNIGNRYDFSLIDNNRMCISDYSFRKGVRTLKRLDIPVEMMGIVAAEYARTSGKNDLEMLNAMVIIRLLHQLRNAFKKWVKTPLHYLTKRKYNFPVE